MFKHSKLIIINTIVNMRGAVDKLKIFIQVFKL